MHDHFPRQRPPWWPENATWPPNRPWRSERGHFFRRIGALLVVLALLVLIGCGTVLTFLASALGLIDASIGNVGLVRVFGVLVVFFVIVSVFGTVRRTVAPLSDVMEAADESRGWRLLRAFG